MRKYLVAGLGALAACALYVAPALAFEFAPIVAQFSPTGPNSSRTFVLRNTQKGTIAVQIESMKRSTAPDGEEIRTPDPDDFIITPPQMVLTPGQSQTIRAQWVGAPSDTELSYRFLIRQVPITYQDQTVDKAGVSATLSVGYNYEAAIYVTPRDAKPKAELVRAEAATVDKGQKVLRLTLSSTGTTRAILLNPKLTVTAGGASVTLDKARLKELDTLNLLAGSTQSVDVAWPQEVAFGPVAANFSTEYLSSR